MEDDGTSSPVADARPADGAQTLCTAQVPFDAENPIAALKDQLGTQRLSLLNLFITPKAPFADVVAMADRMFPGTDVVACTTAGEIGVAGYGEGLIVAVGFPADQFATKSLLIENLPNLNSQHIVDRIALDQVALRENYPWMSKGFAFLVVDGLSLSEDTLTATISPALRDLPLFGGSAGDGAEFNRTQVALNGRVCSDAAVLSLVRTELETRVFSLDHLVPTEIQMVVTEADPDRRVVKSINAEPAAREYARLVGKDPEQLDRFTFASHPVVVRIGGAHHVRAIQQVNKAGELVFYSAIDEGMVLTVAVPQPMARHLDQKLSEFSTQRPPAAIIGCDCILRRIEAEQSQTIRDVSDILSKHHVIGFSTYGEQIGPLHVNHTMSGVAIYPATSDALDKPKG